MRSRLLCFIIYLFIAACTKEEANKPEPEEQNPSVMGDITGKWDIRYPDAPTNDDLLLGYIELSPQSRLQNIGIYPWGFNGRMDYL